MQSSYWPHPPRRATLKTVRNHQTPQICCTAVLKLGLPQLADMATTNEVSVSQDIIICPWPGLAVKIPSAVVYNHPIAFALVSLFIFCYFYWPSGQTKSGQDTGRTKLAKGHNVKEVDVHVDVSEQIDGPELTRDSQASNGNGCNATGYVVPDRHTDQLKDSPLTNPEALSHPEVLDHRDQQDNELSSNIDDNCLEESKIQDQLVPKSDKNTEDDTENHATNEIISESDSDSPNNVNALHHKQGHKTGHREHSPTRNRSHHDLQDITPREAAGVLSKYSWSAIKPWFLHIMLLSVIVILVIYSICTSVLLTRSIAAEKNDIGLQHDSLQDGASPAMPHTIGKEQESPDNYAYGQSQVSPDSNKASSKKTNTKPMIFTPWPGAVIRLPPTGLPWTIGLIPALYFGFRYFSKLNIDWYKWREWRKQALRVISISMATLIIQQQLFPSSGVGIIQEFLQVVSVTNPLSNADAELCRFDVQADSESIHTSEPPLTQPPPEYPSPFIGQHPNAQPPEYPSPPNVQPRNAQPPEYPSPLNGQPRSAQTEYPSEALSPPHGQLPHVPHYNRPPQPPSHGVQSSHNGQPPNTQPRHEYPSSLNGQPPSAQPPAQQPPVETEFSSPHKLQPPPVPHYSTSQPPPVQQFPAEDLRSLPKAQAPSEALLPPHGRLPHVPHYSRPPQRPAGVQSSHNGPPPNAQPHPG